MKKILILLPLFSLHLSLHAQSKWSAGYRLGLVHEETLSGSTNKARNISNQIFVNYRILKRLELEAGLQHNQTSFDPGLTDEMVLVPPYFSFSHYKAQVFSLSLNARYYIFSQNAVSVYALAGLSSCMITGYYEDKLSQNGDIVTSRHSIPNQFTPLASLFAGFGINYQVAPRIKLNAQVAAHATKIDLKLQSNSLPYVYNPDLSTQLGFSYTL